MKRFSHRTWLTVGILVIVIGALFAIWGCSSHENPVAANDTQDQLSPVLSVNNPAVQAAMAVQDRHTARLMADPDVIGTATTIVDGQPAIMILVTSRDAMMKAPKFLEGVRVTARLTASPMMG